MKNLKIHEISSKIIEWLKEKSVETKTFGYVVGVSGGVDSAVVSALCAKTGLATALVSIPIHSKEQHIKKASDHILKLEEQYKNVSAFRVDLSDMMDLFKEKLKLNDLAYVNTASRLRMTTLYAMANSMSFLVVGTGNKVEDYGIGFFTKYGDGGVDISPIGDLLKSEVIELAKYLEISEEIYNAKPTDGLWEDGRTDEDQIGCTYDELEWVMDTVNKTYSQTVNDINTDFILTDRQNHVLNIYLERHYKNKHKMQMPPICELK